MHCHASVRRWPQDKLHRALRGLRQRAWGPCPSRRRTLFWVLVSRSLVSQKLFLRLLLWSWLALRFSLLFSSRGYSRAIGTGLNTRHYKTDAILRLGSTGVQNAAAYTGDPCTAHDTPSVLRNASASPTIPAFVILGAQYARRIST